MTPSFAVGWMLPRIGLFRAEHPDIELMLNPSPEIVDLAAEDYDLAIRWGNGGWPGVESEPLLATHFVVVGSADLITERTIETPADLANFPWLVEHGTDELSAWLRQYGVDTSDKHDVTYLPGYMLTPAVRAGKGITTTARIFVEEDIAAGHLVVLFEDDDASSGYHIVRRAGPVRASVKRFIEWLRREAGKG
jgi:LysR family glycine cleavage system transcriptional activator